MQQIQQMMHSDSSGALDSEGMMTMMMEDHQWTMTKPDLGWK